MAVLDSSGCGDFLAPQLLYMGKTEACHPSIQFPTGWDIWHSESHWSTEKMMIPYVEKIILPYYINHLESLGLSPTQKGLALFDVYKAHQNEGMFQLLMKIISRFFLSQLLVPRSSSPWMLKVQLMAL